MYGRTLLGLANGELTDRDVLAQAKHLMRAALAPHLGERPLHSRQLYAEFLRLAGALPPA